MTYSLWLFNFVVCISEAVIIYMLCHKLHKLRVESFGSMSCSSIT